MKTVTLTLIAAVMISVFTIPASAHFGMVIPSDNMIMPDENRTLELTLSFSHPFEQIGMPLEKPAAFFVASSSGKTDLVSSLKEIRVMDHTAWQGTYGVKRPGALSFVMEPQAYWEPAEDCFIIHYTKTVVAAFGDDTGWDRELGLKTEIIPLTRPFGLYASNLFQGIVKLDGRAVPYAEVEIEYYNASKKVKAPTDYMITQVVKADADGVFTFAVPRSGWWGFAALNTSDTKMVYASEEKDVELGAVLWVHFEPWQEQ